MAHSGTVLHRDSADACDRLTRKSRSVWALARIFRPTVALRERSARWFVDKVPNSFVDGESLYRPNKVTREPRAWSRRAPPVFNPAGRVPRPSHSGGPLTLANRGS